jgi:hypothetical protein
VTKVNYIQAEAQQFNQTFCSQLIFVNFMMPFDECPTGTRLLKSRSGCSDSSSVQIFHLNSTKSVMKNSDCNDPEFRKTIGI